MQINDPLRKNGDKPSGFEAYLDKCNAEPGCKTPWGLNDRKPTRKTHR